MSQLIVVSFVIGAIIFMGQDVNMCQEKSKSTVSWNSIEEGIESRTRTMSRFWRIFLYYCGPEKIDDKKLIAAEKCSPKKLLNETSVAFCDDKLLGKSTLEERRRIKCIRRLRDEYYKKFAKCYAEHNPTSASEHSDKLWAFESMSKRDKRDFLKSNIAQYTDCYEQALDLA